jgi:hypothetical protein
MQSTSPKSTSVMICRCLSALELAVLRFRELLGRKFRVQSMNIDRKPASGLKKAALFV